MKLSIVIPVYNEKRTLGELLRRVEEVQIEGIQEKEIILVDDFSTDGTREILRGLNAPSDLIQRKPSYKIIFHSQNQGKGRAVVTGFKQASGEVAIIQDADLEYDPQDYPRLLQPILTGQTEVVYGSRFLEKNKNKTVYRHGYIFSKVLNIFSNFLTGMPLTDMYTCYKVFSRKSFEKIHPQLRSKRFGIDPELTAWAAKFNFKILEVPISYQGRTYAEGKKINWKDGLAAIWHIIRFNIFTHVQK